MILPLRARRKRCRFCGQGIVIARSAQTGKAIPLDLQADTYVTQFGTDGDAVAFRAEATLVNHFRVCPKARAEGETHRAALGELAAVAGGGRG